MEYIKKHCLFCGNGEDLQLLYPKTFKDTDLTPGVFSARKIAEHFHYTIVKCKRCSLVFSQEILGDDTLSTLYTESTVTFSELTQVIAQDYRRCLEPHLHNNKKERALEIGCSNGFFMEELLKMGFREVQGCEPSSSAREQASPAVKANIQGGFFRQGQYPNNHFDLACSFQTLDHMSDPGAVVKTCYNVLRPGGMAFFVTHNVNGLHSRVFGERSPVFDVGHIYLFNPKTLGRLLREAGFSNVKVFPVYNSYPLSYWMRMAPLPFKKTLLAMMSALGLAGVRIKINAGNIGVAGIK